MISQIVFPITIRCPIQSLKPRRIFPYMAKGCQRYDQVRGLEMGAGKISSQWVHFYHMDPWKEEARKISTRGGDVAMEAEAKSDPVAGRVP